MQALSPVLLGGSGSLCSDDAHTVLWPRHSTEGLAQSLYDRSEMWQTLALLMLEWPCLTSASPSQESGFTFLDAKAVRVDDAMI